MTETATSKTVEAAGLNIHYLEAGSGEPVVLLHGWPTSSYLWRDVIGPIARSNRVIAPDLPGFGRSDKPLDATYSFRFHQKVLDEFIEALGIDKLGLAVHDLGGPIGLYWACHRAERIRKLALLNTLVYPEMSWAVIAFVLACRLPGARSLLASPWGLKQAMRIGIADRSRVTREMVREVQAPFAGRDARQALLKAGFSLSPKGFVDIAKRLPTFDVPVRVVYGERDRILPDVAKTMRRVQRDLPQTQVTALPDCGHFLQEDRPDEVGRLLAEFFAAE